MNTTETKKTAIVSCYFIHNYGSMLQAYATQKLLDKFQIENETINVSGFIGQFRKAQYSYIIKSGLGSGIFKDRLGKAKSLLVKKLLKNDYTRNISKRDKEFDRFADTCIRKSAEYSSIEDLAAKCAENYATVLVGSDQLWLPANIAADYYTLNFVPDEVNSIAFATSFGVSSLPEDASDMARRFLPRIKHISVREQAGQMLIEKLIGRKVPVVCDPTLLFTGEEWLDIQKSEPLYKEPYVFCYFIGDDRKHRDFARRLADKKECKVVALTHVDHYMKVDEGYAEYTPYDIGPAGFLNLIRNARYICTDSFHSTVFSILYEKDFFDFRRYTKETKQSTNSRLDTLFALTGINDRMFTGDEEIDDCLELKIDYSHVNYKLDLARKQAFEYLTKSFENAESTDLEAGD